MNIDRVNRRDLFSWTADGVLQIEGHDTVPQFTVVHLVSNVLGAELVRQHGFREPVATQNAPYLQLPDVPSLAEIKRLAERWTRGIPTGWPQVEAIVEGLRNDFLHDEDAVAPEECGDVVGQFLQARRGPDYVFASAAALLLRSCGYPTRLVSGFYADSNGYDRRAGQTAVVTDDAHVRLEVGASRGTWVPVEPTPGYEPPRMVLDLREFAWTLVRSLAKWSWKHWELVIGGTLLLSVAIRQRRRLVDEAASLVWGRVARRRAEASGLGDRAAAGMPGASPAVRPRIQNVRRLARTLAREAGSAGFGGRSPSDVLDRLGALRAPRCGRVACAGNRGETGLS